VLPVGLDTEADDDVVEAAELCGTEALVEVPPTPPPVWVSVPFPDVPLRGLSKLRMAGPAKMLPSVTFVELVMKE